MPSEFVRDTPQPWYIQYLPFIVYVIIVVIQIIYGIVTLLSGRPGAEQHCNKSALAVGIIVGLVILAILLYIIFMLCRDGWNLSAWFFVLVILICTLFICAAKNTKHHHEEVTLNIQ